MLLILLLGWICGPAVSAAEPNWPYVSFTPVATDVGEITDIQNAGDGSGRLFLVGQNGIIRILKDGALLPTPFLDATRVTRREGEQGLLGLAFPPNFKAKKCFYVYYCRPVTNETVLSRFRMTADPNVADKESEEILLVIPKSYANHNGGQIAFGPDWLLYISVGDGGNQGDPDRNSQNLTKRLGKILRINVDQNSPGLPYGIPAANPFATSTTYAPEILCWGLRNPWRFCFDPLDGGLFIADVGENQFEEINHLPFSSFNAGANFGWSVKEGPFDFQSHTAITGALRPAAFYYDHYYGYSVTGGQIYGGANPRLRGFYLFADFVTGRFWAMESPAAGGRAMLLKDTTLRPSTFGKDEAGEIYFAGYPNHEYEYPGVIYRVNAPDTLPPPAVSPPAGAYTDNVPLRYTTDGTTPDGNSPAFVPGTTVLKTDPFTLRAATFRADLNPSPAVEAIYQLRPFVKIGGGDGNLTDYATIQLESTTPGAEIHYTLDGPAPTRGSPLFSKENGLLISQPVTVRAIAFKEGPGWLPGVVSEKTFYLRVADPVLSQRYYDLHDDIQVTSATTGAILHYTLDGSTPTTASPVWSGPLDLPSATLIRILARKPNMTSATSNLQVQRISTQRARFEALGAEYLLSAFDVVHAGGSTLYAVGRYYVWKFSGTGWTVFHDTFQDSSITWYDSIALGAYGRIAVSSPTQRAIMLFAYPPETGFERWNLLSGTPSDLVTLPDGGLLMADIANHTILQSNAAGKITTLAGNGTLGSVDGPALQASFRTPAGIARDSSGRVFVADSSSSRIRQIGTDGMVTTIAGNDSSGWVDGPLAKALFDSPVSVACDRIGNLYVCELSSFGRIRKIRPDGTIATLRGPSLQPGTNVILKQDSFGPVSPRGMDVDGNGVIYIAGDNTVTKVVQEDWDDDGIPDTTETALGAPFVVGIDDRKADADGDLASNCAEWIAGTNPLLSASLPAAAGILKKNSDGTISLNFSCEPGRTHQLEYSNDLVNWRPMGAPTTSALRSFSARFTASPLTGQRFYRLRSTP